MEITSEEIYAKAARGDVLSQQDLRDIAKQMEHLESCVYNLNLKVNQKSAQVDVLKGMTNAAMTAAGSSRTIDEIREQTKSVASSDSPLFNAFEVAQVVYALDISDAHLKSLKDAYDKMDVESRPARSVKEVMDAINNNVVGPFSFKEVTAWTEYLREHSGLNRPLRNNVREVFQLLKAQPTALFYGEEVRMVREWGTDHDRNLSIVKARLGRAFTDPVGYMDTRFDMMLSKATKRQLLDGRVLTAQAYQHAVFARPDFLKIKPDWKLCDGKTQFHAGEHFHTRATDGLWWCGTHFNDLTGHELMNILETALGELRLLHIHFPDGVTNEESSK